MKYLHIATTTTSYLELYRGGTGSFFGIGILPVSDLLDFRYFGVSIPPFFLYFPPFLPPFFPKGELLKKGAIAPLLRKKGGTAPFFIPKCTDRVFLRYRYGKYREIPTEYRPKIPNRYTTLFKSFQIDYHTARARVCERRAIDLEYVDNMVLNQSTYPRLKYPTSPRQVLWCCMPQRVGEGSVAHNTKSGLCVRKHKRGFVLCA